jgi:hypothetical protein
MLWWKIPEVTENSSSTKGVKSYFITQHLRKFPARKQFSSTDDLNLSKDLQSLHYILARGQSNCRCLQRPLSGRYPAVDAD